MSSFKLIKQLSKIEKECSKNPLIEQKLNEWAEKRKGTKINDLTISDAHELINEFERLKKEYG